MVKPLFILPQTNAKTGINNLMQFSGNTHGDNDLRDLKNCN